MTDDRPLVAPDNRNWRPLVTEYQRPRLSRAVLQLVTTLVPLTLVFAATYRLLALSFWWTLLFALPAAALLVRTFVLMHDCAHGSFFLSKRANRVVGAVTGLLTLIPFEHWRHEHSLHHASAGDLDRRGHGDVETLTVREYLGRSRWGRLRYRIVRHPLVYLLLGPVFFVLDKRVPRAARVRDDDRSPAFGSTMSPSSLPAAGSSRCSDHASCWSISRRTTSPSLRASGCFSCSTSSRIPTGSSTSSGTTPTPRLPAARISSFPRSCSGSPAVSAFITCTISARRFPTTISSAVTKRTRSSIAPR